MTNSKAIWTVKPECGPIREKNEDAIYPDKSGSSSLPIKAGIFDGMGGHKKGEFASLLASKVMNANFINISDYVNLANKNAGWNFNIDWNENVQFTEYKPKQYYSIIIIECYSNIKLRINIRNQKIF